ncbi:tetratricopeptide repeat protein [uncultured Paludibaculum sp.]|uniref:tetratricopeptide repeat protein n=1 Tax=uncultured Paludibaculum sp. TaxID=1765020 RepID=UPI002AAA7B08|nr:tetratricopeptide repeat protein [uncultured Paludibaculum sp.]
MSRLEAVRALVAQDPNNSRIRFMLCMEYLGASDWQQAVDELRDLLARDANYVAAYYQAGRASEELGQEDAARGFYRDGIEAARRTGDGHALSELQAALDILG